MRLALRQEMRDIDTKAAREFGISEEQLMERAGALMADSILSLPGIGTDHRIGILCGPGNNGGDGLVVARKLLEKNFKHINIWKIKAANYSMLFELNLRRLADLKMNVPDLDLKGFDFNKYDLLIDALYGIGLDRAVDTETGDFIKKLNRQKVSVISLDVPSGLEVNTGRVLGEAVRATKTLTCGLAKPGFYLQDGPDHCGKMEILDIGFPPQLLKQTANSVFLIGKNSARQLLPRKKPTANKSKFGKVLVIAGSQGMKGAAVLTATAAARMGAGYVGITSHDAKILNEMPPDFYNWQWKNLQQVEVKNYSAVVIGPGLGVNGQTKELIEYIKSEKMEKVVMDADALSVAAKHKMWPLPETWVLTPHAGEMSKILEISAREIEDDRLSAIKMAQALTGANILLKGFRTCLQSKDKTYIINSGNVALAKAGTGDVLGGFIGSLMAQGLSTDRAAALGSYLHGRIADLWIKKGGSQRTLMASDLPKLLHQAFREIE